MYNMYYYTYLALPSAKSVSQIFINIQSTNYMESLIIHFSCYTRYEYTRLMKKYIHFCLKKKSLF